jgi:asparagine synthetase B (glutamine-hydrolysing)
MARMIRAGCRWEVFESVAPELGPLSGLTLSRVSLDATAATLELSRAFAGGRPVYYHVNPAGEFFCSSHTSLLSKAGVALRENRKSLPEFFTYLTVMPPSTLIEGVAQVPGGATIQLGLVHGRWETTAVARANLSPTHRADGVRDVDDMSHQLQCQLEAAISNLAPRQHQLAVPLSGGLDSSALWTMCHRIHGTRESYSAGFPFEPDGHNREKEYALSAAEAFGAQHRYFEPTAADYARAVVDSIAAAEMPVYHLQSVLLYLLFRDALPREASLVVTGEGAGTLFGSTGLATIFRQERSLFAFRENRTLYGLLSSPPALLALRCLYALTGRGWAGQRTLNPESPRNLPLGNPDQLLWSAQRFGNQEWACRYFGVKPADVIAARCAALRGFEGRSFYDLWVIHELLSGAADTMSIWSKLAEFSGKTLYAPFLAAEVMDLTWAASWPMRLEPPNNLQLRLARQLGIPEHIVARPKSSFGASPEYWARPGGVFEPFLPLVQRLFGAAEVRATLVPDHERAFTFWSMVNYAIWRCVVLEGETAEHLLERVGLPPAGPSV